MIKMRELEDESIDCIVTSPPYFGLRDYGTGKWEGGDPNCDHVANSKATKVQGNPEFNKNRPSREETKYKGYYEAICPKCNAIKIDYVWGGDEKCEHEWSKEPPRRRRHPNDHTKGTLNQIASAPHLKETDSCHKCGGWMGGYGLESTPDQYIKNTLLIFDELHRVLKPQGTVWWNIGDSYAMKSSAWGGSRGHNSILKGTGLADKQRRTGVCPDKLKSKDLMMIPARVAIAVAEHGWYLRSEIIWHKPNPMPESVKDRPTSAHEKIYLFAKNRKYYYDADAIREPQKQDSIARAGRDYWDTNKIEAGQYAIPNVESAKKLNQKVLDTVEEGKIPMANKRNVWTTKYESDEEERMYRQGMSKTRGENVVYVRTKLPTQEDFVKFMRLKTSVKQLDEETDIERTTIEHWFRNDESGFAFPSVEDWKAIRDYVNDWSKEFESMDEGLTYVESHMDSVESNPLGKNKRNVWTVTTKPFRGAHFAVFPPDLIEPCIKAGTSEYGCCSKCGNPYVRNNEVTSVPERTTRDNMVGVIPGRNKKSRMNSKEMESLVREDKGWIATCKCNAEVKKSVVLDPFGGSGTTGLVANNLGRDAVLIELNKDYVDIAKKRLDEYLGLFSEVKDG